MTDSDYQALGFVIAAAVKKATAVLVAEIAELKARPSLTSELRKSIDESSSALCKRIEALEARGPIVGPAGKDGADGRDGKDADPVDVEHIAMKAAALVPLPKDGIDGMAGKDGIDGRDGKDAEPIDLEALARKAAALISTPRDGKDGQDGKDVDPAVVQELVVTHVTKAVADLPAPKDGRDGKDADVEMLKATVAAEVQKAVAELPKCKDGSSVTVDDVVPIITDQIEKAVAAIPRAKDGVGMLGALIDREGQLVVTLSDGTTKNLGIVVGRDVDMGEVTRLITEKVASIPLLKGADGKDGRDGTLDNLKVVYDDDRTVTLCFKDGTPIEGGAVKFPVVIYRGVFDAQKTYERCDSVTFANQQWIAREDTNEKPGTGKAWQLAVRAGRDGREGKVGPEGKPGPRGEQGLGYRG